MINLTGAAELIKSVAMVTGALTTVASNVGLIDSPVVEQNLCNTTPAFTNVPNRPVSASQPPVNINLNFIMDAGKSSTPRICANDSNGLDIKFDI